AINGGAGNEGIGTSSGNLTNIVLVDATIHFKTNVEVAVVDQATHFLEFLQRRRNEFLSAKTGIHRHQQHHVELVHHVFEAVGGGRRVQYQAGLATLAANQLQGAVDMVARFRVEGDVAGAGIGKHLDQAVHRRHHQVHVNRCSDAV